MARPESIAVGGYYPFPPHLIADVAALIGVEAFTKGTGTAAFVDPCAGEGAAIIGLVQALFPPKVLTAYHSAAPKIEVYACEMEATRHATLKHAASTALRWNTGDHCLHGDMFRVAAEYRDAYGTVHHGATVLWHNPPYDPDPVHGRLEQRFLARAHTFQQGGGVLVHIVPHYALGASAELLAREYEQVTCVRLPDPDFAVFKQVALLAVKRSHPLTLDVTDHPTATLVRSWSHDATIIPVLPKAGGPGRMGNDDEPVGQQRHAENSQ
ncbi:MAG: DUF6094 domain-containing protein [Chloroflexales bacterium]